MKEYVTCGFSAYQLTHLFQKCYGTEFYFIHLGVERDRMCNSVDFEFYLLGLRAWMCISVGPPRKELLDAIENVLEKNA